LGDHPPHAFALVLGQLEERWDGATHTENPKGACDRRSHRRPTLIPREHLEQHTEHLATEDRLLQTACVEKVRPARTVTGGPGEAQGLHAFEDVSRFAIPERPGRVVSRFGGGVTANDGNEPLCAPAVALGGGTPSD
jgi:hypothetical protein